MEPEKFYLMEINDFWLLRKGWSDKLVYEQMIARRAAYIIHCSMVSQPAPLKDLWPLPGDEGKAMNEVSDVVRKLLAKQKEGRIKTIKK